MKKQLIENPELKALANITLDAETMFSPEIVDNTLAIIKEKALDFEADVTTKKGQDIYRSKSMTVRKIKTLWINYGKDINREEKKSITVRNIELKKIEEFLDDVAVEVREALTKQEVIEEKAKAKEHMIIKDLLYYYSVDSDLPVETFQNLIEKIKAIEITGDILSDFFIRATQSKESSLASLEKKLADKIQYDKDQAELAILREKNEKQEAKDKKAREKAKSEKDKKLAEKEKAEREEKIKKEAVAKEKEKAAKKISDAKEAEAKAKREKIEAGKKADLEKKKAAEKAEAEKKEAVEAEQRKTKEAAEQAELDKKEWIIREKEKAEQKERDRVAKEEAEQKEADEKAADTEHRDKIKKETCCFIEGAFGLPMDQVEDIFDSISAGEVPHIKVTY